MKRLSNRFTEFWLAALLCVLFALPLTAGGVVYSNGPVNGTLDAWAINQGYTVADSFTVSSTSPVGGIEFAVWLFPGDMLNSVQWSIGTSPGDSTYASGTGGTANNFLFASPITPFNIYWETFTLSGFLTLSPGTYWLTFSNASATAGDPVYWDENDGPSLGWNNMDGYGMAGSNCGGDGNAQCSETFQLDSPEPASMAMLASALVMFAGFFLKFAKDVRSGGEMGGAQ